MTEKFSKRCFLKHKTSLGFTLVEMLVAVTILLIGIGGPLMIGIRGITLAIESKPRVVAIYLAEEGLEIIRNQRDTSVLAGDVFDKEFGNSSTCEFGTGSNKGCMVDAWGGTVADRILNCVGGGCVNLRYIDIGDERRYGHDSAWTESKFKRVISYHATADPDYEAHVKVEVSWSEKGVAKSVRAENYLYSWEGP